MSIIEKLTSFLEEEKILPISEETWRKFIINHCVPTDEQMKKLQYSFIKRQVRDKAGLYIYMKNGICLYVGKAKLLYDRLKSHYIESFSPVPGDTKDMRWHRFFSQHQGELEIYWLEFETEEERQLIEMLLTKLLQPTFMLFK
jgi:excinuclease UvrABC nuclease subunit